MVSPCRNSTIPTRYSRAGHAWGEERSGCRGDRPRSCVVIGRCVVLLPLMGAGSRSESDGGLVCWRPPRSRCAHKKPRGGRHPLERVPPRGGLWPVQLAGQRMRSARFDVRTAVRPAASNAIMATTTATTGAPVCDSCSTAPALPPLPAALFAPSCRSSPVPGFV